MALLSDAEMQKVARAIHDVERKTDAELVTVLAPRSDNYLYIPTLIAAVLALLSPLVLQWLPPWLSSGEILVLQWLVFIVLALVFRIPGIVRWLIPPRVKAYRAENMARRQFLENNLHHTENGVGVLIFVSELEHYIEIIADRGISRHVPNDRWSEIIQRFVKSVKEGDTAEGFVRCIQQCGEHLERHCPATQEKDELPNHLVVL